MDDLKAEIKRLKIENEQLKRRCRVFSQGVLCLMCPCDCVNRTVDYRGKLER